MLDRLAVELGEGLELHDVDSAVAALRLGDEGLIAAQAARGFLLGQPGFFASGTQAD